ncbi:MAG: hypothetical protein RIM72_05670 [Alphaproteobacteria bacterium]
MANRYGRNGPFPAPRRFAAKMVAVCMFAAPLMPAVAQDFSEFGAGALSATSYEPFGDAAPMAVDLLNDSELDTRIAEDVRQGLPTVGHPVDKFSDLVLFISTEITGVDGRKKAGGIGRLYGNSETGVDFSVNIYSGTNDSLLTGAKKDKPGRVVYRLNGEVRRGPDILWQGAVTTEESRGDTYRTFKPLVQTLIEGLGETEVPDDAEDRQAPEIQ